MTELDTAPVVWPSWCYATDNQSEGEAGGESESIRRRSGTPSSGSVAGIRQRKKKTPTLSRSSVSGENTVNGVGRGSMPVDSSSHIKAERFSPELGPESSSRSVSSGSPASPSPLQATGGRLLPGCNPRPPSYPGTPPGAAAFTPPVPDRFSPASLAGSGVQQQPSSQHPPQPLKQMEQMMTRNYSDFMRSLAAKYNNSNPNEYFNNSRNGFLSGLDTRFGFKPASTPLLGLGSFASPLNTGKESSETSRKSDVSSPSNAAAVAAAAAAAAATNNSLLSNFNNFPLIDMSSTQALLNMVRSASAHSASQLETYLKGAIKRPHDGALPSTTSPLDLSSVSKKPRTDSTGGFVAPLLVGPGAGLRLPLSDSVELDSSRSKESKSVSPKPARGNTPSSSASSASSTSQQQPNPCMSLCADKACSSEGASDVALWTVQDVCHFVATIDLCAEYVETFRLQSIDGAALPLLTEDHLINNMNMKLGPALKFRSVLAKRIGHCAVCMHCVHCHGAGAPEKRPSSVGN